MLFQRVILEEEEEGELFQENLDIAHDLKESYVDSSKYDEIPKKKSSFFNKIKKTPRGNNQEKNFVFDQAYLDESMFIVAEEPPIDNNNISRRSSVNLENRSSQT
jgi:hypothetical protein